MHQQQLFSPRQTRRLWIERIVIGRFTRESDSRLARTNSIKHLLRVIESHQGTCGEVYLKLGTIAHEMGVSERTARRQIADAQQLGFLIVSRAAGTASRYDIDWGVIAQAILDNPDTTGVIDPHHRPPQERPAYSAQDRDQRPQAPQTDSTQAGATAQKDPGQLDHDPGQLDHDPGQLDRHPGQVVTPKKTDTYSPRERVLNHVLNHDSTMSKPSWRDDGLKPGFGGWPQPITIDDLKRPTRVQALYEHAIGRGWISEHHRVNFFTLAVSVAHQHAEGQIRNPGGAFSARLRESVSSNVWTGTDRQESIALDAIQTLDRPDRAKAYNQR
jgi:HTH domain